MELGKIFLPQFSGERVSVYQVNGLYVRNNIFLDFTEGGNDQVYRDWIPETEIWLDIESQIEWAFICLHELTERRVMIGLIVELGHTPTDEELDLIYDLGHEQANVIEAVARKDPESAMDLIQAELARQPET